MREFDYRFKDIFKGIDPERSNRKELTSLEECHNLEPLENDYDIHEFITDLNATGISWGGKADSIDYWKDDQNDNWVDDSGDVFKDI